MNKFLLFLSLLLLGGCAIEEEPQAIMIEGLKPIYIAESDNVVEVQPARSFQELGKIVYADPYLLVNERFKGIHVVDNTNPADPIKMAFLSIPGNTDFTLKGQYLYANHGNALKTFRINFVVENTTLTEAFSLEETKAINNFFSSQEENTISALYPPDHNGFFECVDSSKGIVIGWEEALLIDPECQR